MRCQMMLRSAAWLLPLALGLSCLEIPSVPPSASALHGCEDVSQPAARDADGSAVILDSCPNHVARGGSWIDGQWDFRYARRYNVDGWGRENILGFRLARDL